MKITVSSIFVLVAIAGAFLLGSIFLPTTLSAPASPIEPRAIFVVDHGTHSSLVMATERGELIRYSYGDFRYYALRDTSLSSGATALIWPTDATLGRGELPGPVDADNLRRQLVVVVEQIHFLTVDGARADRLMAELDLIFNSNSQEQVPVPEYGLIFAPHPTDYLWNSNSSTMIGSWLRELGVEVSGWALLSSWTVRLAPAD